MVKVCSCSNLIVKSFCFLCLFCFIGCASTSTGSYKSVDTQESAFTPPPGVVRYCWEEPIVDYERVNPGLHSEGKWYNPAHLAVKEVRMGRWKPCKEIRSKTYGRYDR